jgi:hypothetical protein
VRLPLPNGYDLYEGSPISVYRSADDTMFMSCQGKKDGVFGMLLFRVYPDGRMERMPVEVNAFGQGQLILQNGQLYLVAWAGDRQQPIYQHITEYVHPGGNDNPITTPSPTPIQNPQIDMRLSALENAVNALRPQVEYAVTRANYAKDLAAKALGEVSQVFENPYLKDLIWSMSGNRIAAWWNEQVAYKTAPQLLNTVWNQAAKLHRWVQSHPGQEIPLNREETLRM